ncbi:lipopolysaccharide cholinephosphotransferase [Eubacterium ruminantium]|nr:lipopolysaccharide cholinephosphotransferase [Eubacterium ruminantium]
MKLDLENDFIYDAVSAPLRNELFDRKGRELNELHSAYILLVGPDNGFRNYIEESIKLVDREKNLHITLGVSDLNGFGTVTKCNCRDCMTYRPKMINVAEISELWNIRYSHVIITGFAGSDYGSFSESGGVNTCELSEQFRKLLDRVAKISPSKVIFMSDHRVYRETDQNIILAEHEQLDRTKKSFTSILEGMVVRKISREAGIPLAVLRLAPPFGPETGFDSIFMRIAEQVADGEKSEYHFSAKETNFVYISDILVSIFFALIVRGVHGVFNVSSERSKTWNIEEIIAMMRKKYPEKCRLRIDFSEGHAAENGIDVGQYMASLSSKKLAVAGFSLKTELTDAMELMTGYLLHKKSKTDPLGKNFMFKEGYDGKLETVHKILLNQILMVDKICRKHDIKYFLAGGTLLGAIRHHGFIPWDDDVDIMMLREDYDRFLTVLHKELPENNFPQTPDTDSLNHQPFLKIRMDDTKFATKFTAKFPKMHNGIFIDILAHDRTASSSLGRKLHIMDTRMIRSLVFNKWGNSDIKFSGNKTVDGLANIGKKILPMDFLEKNMFKTLERYKGRNTGYLYDGMGRNLSRGAFPEEYLRETLYVDFEGELLPVPKEYDKYLTWLYGDYMKEIPASERHISHSIVWMDLGKYMEEEK